VYLCVLCGFENKQRLFPYTALTNQTESVYCAVRTGSVYADQLISVVTFETLEKAKSKTENVRDLNLAEVKITIFQVSKLPSQQQHDLQHTADFPFIHKQQKYK
jgi:hypothetical protein